MRTSFVVAIVALCVIAAAQPADMLKNSGFEEDSGKGRPRDWSYADFKTGGTGLCDRSAGREGSAAVGIRAETGEQRGSWRQTLQIEGMGALHVSGWYRTEGLRPAKGKGACVRMTYLKEGKGWEFINDKRFFMAPAEEWTHFETVFMTTPGAARVVPELFNFFVPGTVWWDDMVIREATDEEVTKHMAQKLDQPAEPMRVSYSPEDGETVSVNPPAFTWVPARGVTRYTLQYSQDSGFAPDKTVTVSDVEMSVFTPTETIEPGKWHWRYGFEVGERLVFSRTRAFTIPEDATTFPRPTIEEVVGKIPNERPRIYFTPATVAEVRAGVNEKYKAITGGTIRAAEKKIGEELYPEPEFLPERGQERSKAYLESFRTMRPFTGGMETCALAYIYTGDRKFAEEAKRRLLHFAAWDPDGASSLRHNDEAAMDIAMRGPRTFDWIYDTLTEQERKTCTEFLGTRLEHINKMHHGMPFESRPYSSHPGRMIGFMIEGSIVFAHEIPEAKDWLDYTLRLLWSVYPAWGSDDGGWHEGIGYWTAYMGMMTLIVEELDRLGIPWKNKPFVRNTGWFGLYCAYPHRKHAAFGDGHEGRISRGQGNLLYTLASIFDNPYFRWHADEMNAHPSGPMAFNIYRPDMKGKPPTDLPQARAFPHVGWVAMHSNMAEPKNNVLLLFHSTPYGAISHNHANQNAFVLEAFGEPLAISSGYYQRYGCPHHAGWTWETKAHNSILVDGEGQVKRNALSKGFITEFENTEGFCYTTGDATQAYGGRLKKFLRHVLFCRPDYFVIFDELESNSASTYQWLLHAKREMKLDPENLRLISEFEDARLRVQFLMPDALEFSQTDQFDVAPETPDSANQYHFRASTKEPAPSMEFVTVLLPYRAGQEDGLPECKLLEAEGGIALEVGDDLVAWKDQAAEHVRAAALESAAAVTAIRRDAEGNVQSAFSFGEGAVRSL